MSKGTEPLLRVLLAEDHTIVRQGLCALLAGQPGIEIAGEAVNGRDALDACARLQPDVVVMDLLMPILNGVEATREIVQRWPKIKVIILSMHSSEEHVRPALRAGASGYLLKGSGLTDLVAAIRAVVTGNAFFSPEVAELLRRDAARITGPGGEVYERLSTREREILTLVADGWSSPQIAEHLGISPKTVEGHRGRIMEKLAIHDVAGLVRYAIRAGLVSTSS